MADKPKEPINKDYLRKRGILPPTPAPTDPADLQPIEVDLGPSPDAPPSGLDWALDTLGKAAKESALAYYASQPWQTAGSRPKPPDDTEKMSPTRIDEPQSPSSPEGGPLPKTWQEAVPYVVWGVLVLGFGLELVSAFVRGEWLHFIVSLLGLGGLMATALHWKEITAWAKKLNPNWVVATLSLVLAGLILSPFIEQQRWPFINQMGTAPPTIIHEAATPEEIAKAAAPIQSKLDAAIAERDTARRDSATSKLNLEVARVQHPQPPTPEDQIPISWEPDFQFNWYNGPKIAWIRFVGVSGALTRIKDAYIISTLTGHKETLDVANATNFAERWKIDQVEPIPSGAKVMLVYEPKLSPPLPDFMSQWGAFEFHVVYDNKEYVKTYSQDYINSKMTREMPGVFGPRVTPRNDK